MEQAASALLKAGDAAPDLEFLTRHGDARLLSQAWADGPALVLWLRHLG